MDCNQNESQSIQSQSIQFQKTLQTNILNQLCSSLFQSLNNNKQQILKTQQHRLINADQDVIVELRIGFIQETAPQVYQQFPFILPLKINLPNKKTLKHHLFSTNIKEDKFLFLKQQLIDKYQNMQQMFVEDFYFQDNSKIQKTTQNQKCCISEQIYTSKILNDIDIRTNSVQNTSKSINQQDINNVSNGFRIVFKHSQLKPNSIKNTQLPNQHKRERNVFMFKLDQINNIDLQLQQAYCSNRQQTSTYEIELKMVLIDVQIEQINQQQLQVKLAKLFDYADELQQLMNIQ